MLAGAITQTVLLITGKTMGMEAVGGTIRTALLITGKTMGMEAVGGTIRTVILITGNINKLVNDTVPR
jgi:hypothetical protein